jgi:hypothetical protein
MIRARTRVVNPALLDSTGNRQRRQRDVLNAFFQQARLDR